MSAARAECKRKKKKKIDVRQTVPFSTELDFCVMYAPTGKQKPTPGNRRDRHLADEKKVVGTRY